MNLYLLYPNDRVYLCLSEAKTSGDMLKRKKRYLAPNLPSSKRGNMFKSLQVNKGSKYHENVYWN